MHETVRRAQEYATRAHARIDHQRKYSGQPYDVHLRAVAQLVSTVTDDADTIAAAWLHDVVEDTPATFLDLEEEFGAIISRLVAELTDVSRPRDGNRAVRGDRPGTSRSRVPARPDDQARRLDRQLPRHL